MKLILCGSRDWSDRAAIAEVLNRILGHDVIAMHGDARGADRLAAEIARECGWATVPFPVTDADWKRYGRGAGPRRNLQMLEAGAQLVVAFRCRGESPGTDHMVNSAMKAGVPVIVTLEEVSRP